MMGIWKTTKNDRGIMMGIHSSSMGISLTALSIVAGLEIFMLVYSTIDTALFGPNVWKYRIFYLSLLAVAVICIALNLYVKKDIARRYTVLNIANPLCATFFFAWALGVTYADATVYNTVDPTIFMTFSLTVPLSFFLFPSVYAVIVIAADATMLYLAATVTGSVIAPLLNLSFFFIFQFVLGTSFLRLKLKLAERIAEEQKNAGIDVMTGLPNRRVYEEDMNKLADGPAPDGLVYIVLDINGLKEANDTLGHEAGDKLIIGTAHCIEECFARKGKAYRIGGDEFAAMLHATQEELDALFRDYEQRAQDWSARSGLTLRTAIGAVCSAEYPDQNITGLAHLADERMYAAKARYYHESGKDRRR